MSGDFMQDWFTLLLACAVGFGPATTVFAWSKHLFGNDVEDQPTGCVVTGVILFLAGFPLTWLVFHYFHVVWR